MFEGSLITLLAADSALTALLSTFSSAPAIFTGMAPQKAVLPYIVFDISKSSAIDNLAMQQFDATLDIYHRQESAKEIRQIAERIEFVCDTTEIRTDDRFGVIRLYYQNGSEVDNSDIKIKHYVCQLYARSDRKKWAEDTI